MAYIIDQEWCVGCRSCAHVCAFGAISNKVDTLTCIIDPELCVECGSCVPECPVEAIALDHAGTEEQTAAPAAAYTRVWIEESECIGCSLCKRNCPAEAIDGVIKQPFHIDPEKCVKCGICIQKCPKKAIYAE